MAEFQEVMNKFHKLCDAYQANGCKNCPIGISCVNEADDDPENFEKIVMEWGQPIYPTFLELVHYLAQDIPNGLNMPLSELMMLRIPEDKAEELGLMPINECGLNKYADEVESEWR